ncbi:MAG: hypothetical protein EOM70_03995 [Clostridia bacterium]|nr:hypothetical protein [Clostridia bacterium]
MPDSSEAYDILYRVLENAQSNHKIRRIIATLLILALLGALYYFVAGLLPGHYQLSISGGDILSKSHYLVKVLQQEGLRNGLELDVFPVASPAAALQAVSSGELDLALVPSGSTSRLPDVEHVAALPAETVHLLVQPGITDLAGLKSRVVNTGALGYYQRDLAAGLLGYAGLFPDVDYIETQYTDEELTSLRADRLPDALFAISYMPSYLVDYFVQAHGYQLIALPFADSISYRYHWASTTEVPAGIYKVDPAVPLDNLPTLGVGIEIIAHAGTDPKAITAFLETLYQSSAESVIHQPIVEEDGSSSSIFPLSAGTRHYLKRDQSIFTMEFVDSIKNIAGSIMAFLSTLIVVIRWFKGKKKEEEAG